MGTGQTTQKEKETEVFDQESAEIPDNMGTSNDSGRMSTVMQRAAEITPGTRIFQAAGNLTWDHFKVAVTFVWAVANIVAAMALMAVEMTTVIRAGLVIWSVGAAFIMPVILWFSIR